MMDSHIHLIIYAKNSLIKQFELYFQMNSQEFSSSVVDALKITIRDTVKQSVKQTIKEAIRDTVKDTVKDTIKDTIKDFVSNLTWKHALMIAIPTGILIYHQPIYKILKPYFFKTAKEHMVMQGSHIKEIILTSCEYITAESIDNLHIIKGMEPKLYLYKQNQILVIEKFKKSKHLKKDTEADCLSYEDEIVELYSQNLWNNFRLSKIQNPNLKIVLIKASEDILKRFFLKFYHMGEKYIQKVGSFGENKLNILRYDNRTKTYEHLSCVFERIQDQQQLKE